MTRYRPSPPPLNQATLPEYVRRELNRISAGFQELEESLSAAIASAGGSVTVLPFQWQRGAAWIINSGAIQVPVNEVNGYIERSCAIKQVRVITEGGPGSCDIDVWASTTFPPTVSDSLLTQKVSLSDTVAFADNVLAGWASTSLTAGQYVTFNLDDTTIFQAITLILVLEAPSS